MTNHEARRLTASQTPAEISYRGTTATAIFIYTNKRQGTIMDRTGRIYDLGDIEVLATEDSHLFSDVA